MKPPSVICEIALQRAVTGKDGANCGLHHITSVSIPLATFRSVVPKATYR